MRRLTRQAIEDKENFELLKRSCSCHISAPCVVCTHPGNPENEFETEEVEPIYWQHPESDSVGVVFSHEQALDMGCQADVYISKELFMQRIKEGFTL